MSAVLAALGGEAVGGIVKTVGNVIDDLVTTDEERAASELEAQKLDNQLLLGQQEINKAEAQHASLFVAGWRPAVGWVCAIALGLIYIPQSLVKAALWTYQVLVMISAWKGTGPAPVMPPYPDMGVADLVTLLLALLGMAGLRHRETLAGKARSEPLRPQSTQQDAP